MLRRLRNARFGQVALAIAGLLAIAGSFGLHPEPSGADGVARGRPLPGWSVASVVSGGSHGCPACLAHRAAPVARLVVALLAPPAPARACDAAPVATPRVSRSLPHDGRAPPRRA
jgi:hypothetical protein